jgi:repressor LexA
MKNLTTIQTQILEFIINERSTKGKVPTLAEIASSFGYKNRTTVQQHLEAIEKKGYIKRNPHLSRGIELTLEEKFFMPRPVLGEVAAGNPLTIYPGVVDIVDLPTIVRMPPDSFVLKVKGDSLKDAYIFSGDYVIVKPGYEPRNGQIVVAILDDAAVVKRFFRQDDVVELRSENPEYRTITVEPGYTGFRMVGVVSGIYRCMES